MADNTLVVTGREVLDPLAEIDFGIDAKDTTALFETDPPGDIFIAKAAVTWVGESASRNA